MKILLLLLISFSSFGQATFHSLLSDPVRQPLALGDVVAFPLEEARAQGAINLLVTPTLLYDSGKCHLVYQNPTDGSKNILTYDERYGVSRPIRFMRDIDVTDSHHRPAVVSVNDTLYLPVETDHNHSPIGVIKARYPNDELVFQLSNITIGTGAPASYPTYPTFYQNKDGIHVNIGQVDDIETAFNKNTSGYFGGTSNWTANAQITTRAAIEDEHYPLAIYNKNPNVTNKLPFVVNGRNDDLQPARWFRRYLIKADITSGGVTYYNWDESFSKTSQLTDTELATNFKYYDVGTDTAQSHIPTPALDDEGNFYDVAFDGDSSYELIVLEVGQSPTSPTIKPISLPGSPDLQTLWEAGGTKENGQNGANVVLLPISKNDLRLFMRVLVGGWNKIYQYQSMDQGDTWEEIGDTLPGVNSHIGSMLIPYNFGVIHNNRNFVIAFFEVKQGTRAGVWLRKAAFGTVQNDDGNPYDDVTAYSESEYDALMARSYYIEAGKVSLSGTTLTGVTDQSPAAVNITTIAGSPVVDNGTTPTYLQLDGTNDRLTIPTTGLTTASEGMIIGVAKMVDATNGNFFTASNNTTTTDYLLFGKSASDVIRFSDSNVALISGQTDVTDDYHIFVFLFQNGDGIGESDVLQFLDGALQQRVITSGNAVEGGFFDTVGAGLTHLQIGALVRTTTAFYNFRFKHLAISTEPFSYEQLRKSLKYLGTKYGITLNSGYQ